MIIRHNYRACLKIICLILFLVMITGIVSGSFADHFSVSYTTYDTTYEKILNMYLRVIDAYGTNNAGRHDLFNDALYGGIDPMDGREAIIAFTKKYAGYMIYDVNQDGIDELLIGFDGSNINSVFTIDNGKVRELIRAGGYGTASSNYTCSLLVDGSFFRWGHGGAALDYYEIWQMNGTGPVSFAGGYHTGGVWDAASQTEQVYWYRSNAPMSKVTSPSSARVNSAVAEKWLRTQQENVYTKKFVPFTVLEKYPEDPWNIAVLSVNGSQSSAAKVNVRKEADDSSKLVASKDVGTYVRVLSKEGSYFKIAFGKLEGYIRQEYLTPLTYKVPQDGYAAAEKITETSAAVESTDQSIRERYPLNGTTNKNSVNVRQEKNKKSRLVVTIKKKGSQVTVKGESADDDDVLWYEVEYKGKEGFVRSDFIDLEEPVTAGTIQDKELYGLVVKKLATRSGPSPRAKDTGTYSLKGKRIRVYTRAYDPIENAWWVKCDVPYRGEIRTLWAWYTRFDSKILPLESIPIENDVPIENSFNTNNTGSGASEDNSFESDRSSGSNAQNNAPSAQPESDAQNNASSAQSESHAEYVQVLDHYEDVEVERSRQVWDHDEVETVYYEDGSSAEITVPIYRTEYYTVITQRPVYRSELRENASPDGNE